MRGRSGGEESDAGNAGKAQAGEATTAGNRAKTSSQDDHFSHQEQRAVRYAFKDTSSHIFSQQLNLRTFNAVSEAMAHS